MNGRNKFFALLLTVTLIVPLTGCKWGKAGGFLGDFVERAVRREVGDAILRKPTVEERAAFNYVRNLYQPWLSEQEKKEIMDMLLPDEPLKRTLNDHGPDPILEQLEREHWNEPSRSIGEVMITSRARENLKSPEKLRGVMIFAKSEIYVFFPPGTLKPGSDGRQTALRKLTLVNLLDNSWRVVKDEVVLKHPENPMTFQQFLDSEDYENIFPVIQDWKRGETLL
ncbi:hypothetical protein [Staphylospora marina]|uniref:hypothetical protein n=1 Tax=Staphylospora marina TaxID=2490858 RepID=UPI000F5BEE2A|nr:hypothetical protein [Staphylospora marina]